MHTFVQKARQPTSDATRRPPAAQSAALSPVQQLQRRVGNQALQRMAQAHAGKAKEGAAEATPSVNAVATTKTPLPQKIKFWMNSFIPDTVDGGTTVAKGKYKGKTMFPGPLFFSDCFLSDSRGFSTAIAASSRIHLELDANLSSKSWTFAAPRSSGTAEIDCEDNDVECEAVAKPNAKGYAGVPIQLPGVGPQFMQFSFSATASDPCVTAAPDIDMNGIVSINPTARLVGFIGMIEPFPAFEAYVTIDGGAPQELFTSPVSPGSSVWSLFGGATVPVTGVVPF